LAISIRFWCYICLLPKRFRPMKEVPGPSQPSPPLPAKDEIIRFGTFEVDVRAGELRRGGLRVKLSGQPFDVLMALLEKPGQVVTREELHEKLWAHDTFVDFEHGLNKAINRVREALGDDADNPRFVETLPRRGYRFLVPVVQPAPEVPAADGAADQSKQGVLAPTAAVRSHHQRWMWFSALALAALIVVVIVVRSGQPRPPKVLRYTQLTNDGLKKSAALTAALATDGSRIYFGEQDSQHGLIAQVSVTGGSVTTVASFQEPGISALDYSSARSELLINFGVQSPLWALSIPGDSARRRVGNFVVDNAAWSPDKQSIVYGSASELTVVKADGSEPRNLATVPGIVDYPRWSPDGKALRFSLKSLDNVRTSIWEIAADGTNLHPVFPDWKTRNDYGGSWTMDGRYFVYNSFLPNGHGSIFAIREKKGLVETGSAAELTAGPMSFSAPIVGMDGRKIFAIGFLDQGELMRYDGKTHTWVSYLSGISAGDVDFSRDGEWVTYVLVPEGTLWRSRVDGSERLQLTIPPLRTSLPRWSPDRKHIAFVGLRPGGTWTIYLVPADGGGAEQLVPESNLYQDPTWSPDGNRLVFGDAGLAPNAIHILDLQSHRVSDLPGSKGLFSPRWAPDGRFILANTGPLLQTQKMMLFDVKEQKWEQWCESSSFNYPSFSRDGKYVYFSDPGAAAFYRVRRGDCKIEPVAKIDVPGGMKQDDFWFWSGLAPDDSPLFLRDSSAREIYALDVDFP
jgi:Tol biopolymer transport system component/DNA-binding winged helix-turn-helix (wHTH) protein